MAPPPIETTVFVLSAETRIESGCSQIVFYGTSPLGAVRVTTPFQPFFFVDAVAALPPPSAQAVTSEEFRSLDNLPVRKLVFENTNDADHAKSSLKGAGVRTYESDIRPRDRFFMESFINGGMTVNGVAEKKGSLSIFRDPRITPTLVTPRFTICSVDIETSMTDSSVLCIGVHLTGADCAGASIDVRHVFMRGSGAPESDFPLTFVPDERVLLNQFTTWFQEADPDIVIGWNVIGFDLTVLQNRAREVGANLALGRERRDFFIGERTDRFSRVTMPGRVILDGPQLLRVSFHSFESYSLEFVSRAVLGTGKLISPGGNKGREIEDLFKNNKRSLAEYNLKDCVLVTEIFEKLQLLDLTVRRVQLSGRPLDQVGMSVASFDHFFLPRLHRAGFVAPDVDDIGKTFSSTGGYVMSPDAGIYDGVIGLDFQSLYPSIIRTFFIDPFSRTNKGTDAVRTPSGHVFSRTMNFLPEFIGELVDERRKAKREKNAPLSQAIKILMNSFYGVMGSPGSRLYHPDLPDAITGTGQWLLTESKRWLEDHGHTVIYGDTDSLFVKPSESMGAGLLQGEELGVELTNYWHNRLKKEFEVDSHLVLEFKKLYRKFLVPTMRSGEGGAKKRYAGLVVTPEGEELEFVGLEVVRSDTTPLARDFQVELYTKVFHGEPLQAWLRQLVADVRAGKFDDKLVYRKRLHKRPNEYGKSPPPYARAALQLERPGRDVRYVITTSGPVPLELHPRNPDYAHYIQKQLKPVADSILTLIGTSFDDLTLPQQIKLFW